MSALIRPTVNLGLLVLFAAGVVQFGFYPAVTAYLVVHMLYLGVRPLWLPVGLALGALVFFYAVFDWALGVPVPGGTVF